MLFKEIAGLSNNQFKRITGVARSTFNLMLRILEVNYALIHAKGGRESRLSLEDKLLIALSYWREYRTYAHIGISYGYSESQICRTIQQIEHVLIKSGKFNVCGKKKLFELNEESVLLIDATESPIQRPKKNRKSFSQEKREGIL